MRHERLKFVSTEIRYSGVMYGKLNVLADVILLLTSCSRSLASNDEEFSDSESALSEAPASSLRMKELEDAFEIIDEFVENVLPGQGDLRRNIEASRQLHEQWPRKKVVREIDGGLGLSATREGC